MFIRSAYAVSPQGSFNEILQHPKEYIGDRFIVEEPDYTKYIDAKLIRRMSRIIKMGVAAAIETLRQANVSMPDAIITGTAYGCLADTDQFLTRMVEFNEALLSPTAFIQSTHNTVGAQIALLLKCHFYNNTFVHRGSSFEAALLDAIALIQEGDARQVLVGAADEIIEKSHTILQRFGLYKTSGASDTLIDSKTKGTMAGEGATFFLISEKPTEYDLAKLEAVQTFYKLKTGINAAVASFLKNNNTSAADLDLIILGHNGDAAINEHYEALVQDLFSHIPCITYKQYCGEYPTSSAFALWMAVQCIATGKAPGQHKGRPKKVLIYNNYKLQYPSLYLLSAC